MKVLNALQQRIAGEYIKNKVVSKNELGNSVLAFMEKTIKEVKGENFDLRDIMYEFEAGIDDFSMFENSSKLRNEVENRTKVLGSMYMKDGWGSNDAFLKRNFNPDTFVFGVGNIFYIKLPVHEQIRLFLIL